MSPRRRVDVPVVAPVGTPLTDLATATLASPAPVAVSGLPQTRHGFTIGQIVGVLPSEAGVGSASSFSYMIGRVHSFCRRGLVDYDIGVDFSKCIEAWNSRPGALSTHKLDNPDGYPLLPSKTGWFFVSTQLVPCKFNVLDEVEIEIGSQVVVGLGKIYAVRENNEYFVRIHAESMNDVSSYWGSISSNETPSVHHTPTNTILPDNSGRWLYSDHLTLARPDTGPISVTVKSDGTFECNSSATKRKVLAIRPMTLRAALPKEYKAAIPTGVWRTYSLPTILKKLTYNGVPAQVIADALVTVVVTHSSMTAGTATQRTDELVKLMEQDSATIVIGAHLFKLQMVRTVDGSKYAAYMRRVMKDKVDTICATVLETAKQEAEMQKRTAEQKIAQAEQKVQSMLRSMKAAPDWVVRLGIPFKFPSEATINVGFILPVTFKEIEALYGAHKYIWDFAQPISQGNVLAWLPLSVEGRYSQTSLYLDDTTQFFLPHISKERACFTLQDIPPTLKSVEEYERLKQAFARSMHLINLNSLLTTPYGGSLSWPNNLLKYFKDRSDLDTLVRGCRIGRISVGTHTLTSMTCKISPQDEARGLVTVERAVAAMSNAARETQRLQDVAAAEAQRRIAQLLNPTVPLTGATQANTLTAVDMDESEGVDTLALTEAQQILRGGNG